MKPLKIISFSDLLKKELMHKPTFDVQGFGDLCKPFEEFSQCSTEKILIKAYYSETPVMVRVSWEYSKNASQRWSVNMVMNPNKEVREPTIHEFYHNPNSKSYEKVAITYLKNKDSINYSYYKEIFGYIFDYALFMLHAEGYLGSQGSEN